MEKIHSSEYIQQLKELEHMSQAEINDFCLKHDSIAMTCDSFKVAYEAAAYCVTLTQEVATGRVSFLNVTPQYLIIFETVFFFKFQKIHCKTI